MNHRLSLTDLLAIGLVLLLGACSTFIPKQHLIPTDRIVGKLQEKFPLHNERPSGIPGLTLTITIASPKLILLPEDNRVRVEGDFIANAGKPSVKGHFALSSALRYDRDERAVFLKEARLDVLQSQGGKDFPEVARSRIGRRVVESVERSALYRAKPGELVALGVELEVEALDVVQDGIQLTLRRRQ